MKRFAAILLLILLLFNWFGYRFVINYLQIKADSQLNARLDSHDYDESQLIEIRINLNIPYQYTWSDFERSYGEVEVNGKIYTYVKRKIEDGVLVLKCISNIQKQNLRNAGHVMFNANNGIGQDGNEKSPSPLAKVLKSVLNDFDHDNFGFNFTASSLMHKRSPILDAYHISPGFLSSSEQPPDWCS